MEKLGLLGWESLRLDAAEVGRFLRREHTVPEKESTELLALADGWAVAVTLLAKRDPSRPARSLSLADLEDNLESVFDYLASEIFDRLPKPTQTLLLRISLLPTFTASMAGELAEQPDAERLLSDLRRDHLLIVRHGATDSASTICSAPSCCVAGAATTARRRGRNCRLVPRGCSPLKTN